jgi:hypothetical protein
VLTAAEQKAAAAVAVFEKQAVQQLPIYVIIHKLKV